MISEKEISDKYLKHFGDEKSLISIKPCLYPYYHIQLKCIYKEYSEISPQEVVIFKFLLQNYNEAENIRLLMGLSKRIFNSIIGEMHIRDYIQRIPGLHKETLGMTERGKKIFESSVRENYETDSEFLFLDGITNDILKHKPAGIINESDKKKYDKIESAIKIPSRTSWEENFYRRFYNELQTVTEGKKEKRILHEIIDLEKSYKIFELIYVLIFKDKNEDEKDTILVLDENGKYEERQEEISIKIEELEEKGIKVITFDKEQNEKKKIEQNKNQKIENITIATSQTIKHITTYEHPDLLVRALKESKEIVIIFSPWIRSEVVSGEIISLMEQALKKKVKIYIAYGMAEKNENDIDKSIRFKFDRFLKDYKNFFSLKATTNMHSKVLVCDNKFAVATSFNWLSFKGDKNRPIRDETGTYSEDVEYIKELKSDRLKFFSS
jgi:hypothetical protein